MRWDESHRSSNVIDRRDDRQPVNAPVGAIFTLFRMFGWPGAVVGVLLVGGMYVMQGRGGGARPAAGTQARTQEDRSARFVGFVLDDTQSTWTQVFARQGRRYTPAQLVLFRDRTRSGCGVGDAAMGPFYCPLDQRVYIDLGFYQELAQRFGAPGDFAQAYVIAHEVGHHVQHLLGTDQQVRARVQGDPSQERPLSVRQELQADCYAGVWARASSQRNLLDPDDMDEALRAASAIGDDRLQRQAGRAVNAETWTHGSAQQRSYWLRHGYDTGDLAACDTFAQRSP